MISFITGKIGGGKTLLALTQMLDRFALGRKVVSNIQLDLDRVDYYMRKRRGLTFSHDQYQHHDFEDKPNFQEFIPRGTLNDPVSVYIDEAHLYYNSQLSAHLKNTAADTVSFLTQSRKFGVDVIMITQAIDTVYRQFRLQALVGYRCRDLRQMSFGWLGKLPAMGLHWVKYDIESNQPLERGKSALSKELFACYSTAQVYDTKAAGLMDGMDCFEPIVPRRVSFISKILTKK